MKNWHSWFSLLNGRVAELPRGRAHARHPRTAFSSLLPIPYEELAFVVLPLTQGAPSPHYLLLSPPYSLPDGSPLHSVHALPSPPSSLFPTFFSFFGGKVRRDVYIKRPYTCVAGCTVRYRPSTIIEFVPVPNPMRAGFSRHVLDRLRRWLICHTARHGRD